LKAVDIVRGMELPPLDPIVAAIGEVFFDKIANPL
jgi:hypothetical protein